MCVVGLCSGLNTFVPARIAKGGVTQPLSVWGNSQKAQTVPGICCEHASWSWILCRHKCQTFFIVCYFVGMAQSYSRFTISW